MRRSSRDWAALVALPLLGAAACGRSTPSGGRSVVAAESGAAGAVVAAPSGAPSGTRAMGAMTLDAWTRAKAGEADDLARLADREGARGLMERGDAEPAWRLTAVRALAFDDGFEALPWLAAVARGTDDLEARAALESVIDLAARPRRATDPEDAAELKAGADALLALAKDAKTPRPRRVLAVRALRMLAERGAVSAGDIPADVDAR